MKQTYNLRNKKTIESVLSEQLNSLKNLPETWFKKNCGYEKAVANKCGWTLETDKHKKRYWDCTVNINGQSVKIELKKGKSKTILDLCRYIEMKEKINL